MSKLEGLYSRLNLDGDVPDRARPRTFFKRRRVWGPDRVPSTLVKNLQRALVGVLFCGVAAAVFYFGHQFFTALNGG